MTAKAARVRTSRLVGGEVLRVELGRPGQLFVPARNYRDSEVVIVKSVERRGARRAGVPYELRVQRGNGDVLTAHFSGFTTQMVGERRAVIDADCPGCGWPERWLDRQARRFGCSRCTYTSKERDK